MTIQINLSKGQIALVDDIDADLAELKWSTGSGGYAQRIDSRRRTTISMHRVILERIICRELLSNEYTDHINRDKRDNRRENLRLCSPAENSRNRSMGTNNSSGILGVHWNTRKRKWRALIKINGVQKCLGYFARIEDAAMARHIAENELFGEFSPMHFKKGGE